MPLHNDRCYKLHATLFIVGEKAPKLNNHKQNQKGVGSTPSETQSPPEMARFWLSKADAVIGTPARPLHFGVSFYHAVHNVFQGRL